MKKIPLWLAILLIGIGARADNEPKFLLPIEGPIPEEPAEVATPSHRAPVPVPSPVRMSPSPSPLPIGGLLASQSAPLGYVRLDSLPPAVGARRLSDGTFAGVLIQPKSSAFVGEQPNNFGLYFQKSRTGPGRILHGDINKQLPWCKLAFAVKKDARGQKILDAKRDPVYLRYSAGEIAQKTGAYQHVSKSIQQLTWGDTSSVEIMMDTQKNAQTAEFLQCFVGTGKNWQSTYREPSAREVAETMSSVATFYVKLR